MKDQNSTFELKESITLLKKTPNLIGVLLSDISSNWIETNEGEDTWSPYDILGHLIHGELTDWIPRARIILSDSEDKTFEPFKRNAMFEESKGKTIQNLIQEFTIQRKKRLDDLENLKIQESHLNMQGIHPALGKVTLKQLIATWVVHDLSHLAHILRVMAKRYKEEVGPWIEYLRILNIE